MRAMRSFASNLVLFARPTKCEQLLLIIIPYAAILAPANLGLLRRYTSRNRMQHVAGIIKSVFAKQSRSFLRGPRSASGILGHAKYYEGIAESSASVATRHTRWYTCRAIKLDVWR